ncbi:MAG: SGNH/GDSL hydrolase family protein [Acidobacteria bacterium]|jgi:lysophospholipase L1-like esterase|nr:SGNH/GDSL hydrolase family protein [Acidobacteriota bacterium]
MKAIVILLIVFSILAGLPGQEPKAQVAPFTFQNREFRIRTVFTPGRADVHLQGDGERVLSAGMPGENIHLGTRVSAGNFYVFWLNHRDSTLRLACFDFQRDRSRVLALAGFSFIGLPEIHEENGELRGLVFLGNRSANDDLFYYEMETGRLAPLTATPFSEKGFTLLEKDGLLEIETRSLWAHYRYRFDPLLLRSTLLESERFAAGQSVGAAAPSPEYYNTYIGFGDSITWGEIDGEQQIESCYLTQMRDLLANPAYAHYYGSASFVNLGVPGDSTTAGAKRVDNDLDIHPGFYFLLMLGLNDAININLSVASSLENLSYIIDAAKARGMRTIVSTVTPSKSIFSTYEYFWLNLGKLNSGILALAGEKGVASIDSYSAFMNTNPPNGWKNLLENISEVGSGNHPNAAGHALIASLFSPVLVQFPPQVPQNISVVDPLDIQQRQVYWNPCYESDFSHFRVEFGFQPQRFSYSLDTTAAFHTFPLFPFLPQFNFRLQTVDRGNRRSAFAPTGMDPLDTKEPDSRETGWQRLELRKDK